MDAGGRVAVLEAAFAGGDRCDGLGLGACAIAYEALLFGTPRNQRLRRLRAACAAPGAAADALDGVAGSEPPAGGLIEAAGGWDVGDTRSERAECHSCADKTAAACEKAALAAHFGDPEALAAVADAGGASSDRGALVSALNRAAPAARRAAVVAACSSVEARGRAAFLADGPGASAITSCGACVGLADDDACAADLRGRLYAAGPSARVFAYEAAFAGAGDLCAGASVAACATVLDARLFDRLPAAARDAALERACRAARRATGEAWADALMEGGHPPPPPKAEPKSGAPSAAAALGGVAVLALAVFGWRRCASRRRRGYARVPKGEEELSVAYVAERFQV